MKKLTVCFIVFLLSLSYSAFSQCRVIAPDAEEWIENNKEKIAAMTRPEWNELEEGYKWIVFTKLSSEQKHNFFKLKIEQVRDSFEWKEDEKIHLEKLHQLFVDNPDIYSEERDSIKTAKIDTFLKEWTSYATEKLKWTPQLIQGIALSCNDLADKEGNIRTTAKIEVKELDLGKLNDE